MKYEEAKAVWEKHHTSRYFEYLNTVCLSTKKYGDNLKLTRYTNPEHYGLVFYDTEIVQFHPEGWVISVDGWFTPTTFRRIEAFTGLNLCACGRAKQLRLKYSHRIGRVWVDHKLGYVPFEDGMFIPYDKDMTKHEVSVPKQTRMVPAPGATRQFSKELREILASLQIRFYMGEFGEPTRPGSYVAPDIAIGSWTDLLRCARTNVMADPWDVNRLLGVLIPTPRLPRWQRLYVSDYIKDEQLLYQQLHRRMHQAWLEWSDLLVEVPYE